MYLDPRQLLSFLGVVNIANKLAAKSFPHAKLYEVEATPLKSGTWCNTIPCLSQITVIYQDQPGHIAINNTGKSWGNFNKPTHSDGYWLGDLVIDALPKITAVEAVKFMKEAGYGNEFGALTLRHILGAPTNPFSKEAFYIFHTKDHGFVFVSGSNGTVLQTDS